MKFATLPEFQADAEKLVACLLAVEVDGVIAYATLSVAIQRDVQGKGRSALMKARKMLQRTAVVEERRCFAPVIDVGLKRLNDEDIVRTSRSTVKRIHRTAGRGIQTLATVRNPIGLTNESKVGYYASTSLLFMFREITRVQSLRQIEAVVAVAKKTLPLADTLRAFRGSS